MDAQIPAPCSVSVANVAVEEALTYILAFYAITRFGYCVLWPSPKANKNKAENMAKKLLAR
jgi:hypothetical protein